MNIENCTGCGACVNICPQDALKLTYNNEGFLHTIKDFSRCTDCNLCKEVCPVVKDILNNNFDNPKCYAVKADDKIRKNSSSGGVFPIIAKYILNNDGCVAGAAFDKNWMVEHIIIDNSTDLNKLKKSKYVQSDIKLIFRKIKDLLQKEDRYVLFSGSPCQVAGLKSFLRKDYEKLLTIDLICGGTLPSGLWKKFINEKFPNEEIYNVDFRNKELGWECATTTTITTNRCVYYNTDWMDLHLKFLAQNTMCPECKYKSLPRQGDLTIADFWGIKNYSLELYDEKGVSLVLLNNYKGEQIFKAVNKSFILAKEVPLEFAKSCPQALVKKAAANPKREKFFKLVKHFPIKKSMECALYDKYDVGIMGLWFYENYGAILTQVALHNLIEQFGLIPVLIDNSGLRKEPLSSNWAKDFCKKWCNTTDVFHSSDDLIVLNDKIDTFISGCDQLWNYQPFGWSYFLDFVFSNKKRISVATSFGHNYIHYRKEELPLISYYLNKYDLVTVREKSGVDICRNDLNIEAVQILDPVFLCDKKMYSDIIRTSNLQKEVPFIAVYILRNSDNKNKYIENLSKSKNMQIIKIEDAGDTIRAGKEPTSVEDFLWYISNAEYVITDSFHATTFSLIFNKKFLAIQDNKIFDDRFNSIANLLNISEHIIDKSELEQYIDIDKPINYKKVNEILEQEKKIAISLLQETLFKTNEKYLSDYDVSKINLINLKRKMEYLKFLSKYKYKYLKYRLLSNLSFGKKREYYKNKKRIFKELLNPCEIL